jgi:hypothetical protein
MSQGIAFLQDRMEQYGLIRQRKQQYDNQDRDARKRGGHKIVCPSGPIVALHHARVYVDRITGVVNPVANVLSAVHELDASKPADPSFIATPCPDLVS